MAMKLKLIAGAGALVGMLAAGPVLAADIPAAPVVKAPIKAAAYNWYGFYIGVHGGYGWGRGSVDLTPNGATFATTGLPTSMASNAKGFIGGVQWGSNWQFNQIVLGTESDFSYTDIKSSQTATAAIGAASLTESASQRLKWFGTTRVRGGVLVMENVLLYATGGLASGSVESSYNFSGTACVGPCPTASASKTLYGWAAGGGIEYGSGPWQFRVEYLHYDLGHLDYTVTSPFNPLVSFGASAKVAGDIVRGGVSYRFNWTPLGLILGTDRL